MQLKRLGIKNYRIINDITIEIDKSLTLIVGRNNTGKTSLMKLLTTVLTGSKIKFNDYPINCRKKIYETFENFKNKNISFQDVQSAIQITSITMYIDYKDEKETDPLGFLSPFIIDTDINITEVKILIQYKFSISEQELFDLLNEEKDIPNVVKSNFFKFFSLQILAINPKDENDILVRTKEELSALLPIKTISAERGLDESEQKNETPLSPLLNRILGDNNSDDKEIKKNIEKLKQTISGVNNQFQKDVNKIISDILQKSIVFGYPNTEEMQIFAETEIALDEEIKKNTNLSYCFTTDNRETLPDSYNGLGYKNLLKIILQLYEFANTINQNS
ncbi:MAG: AAA family ATPase, partial [Bacteroidaceae bacterium]|nr:AAA family ATPase [Bacteroidaceae bacterium]